MTRSFSATWQCPKCGHHATCETAFERWIRGKPELDSRRVGLVRFDLDILLHRYKFDLRDAHGSRDIQAMMFVEVKTHGADLNEAQRDTLSTLSQIMRNRRSNMYEPRFGKHADDHTPPAKTRSAMFDKEVALKLFGGHLLQFEHETPADNGWIKWDYKPINARHLISLLLFEIDPDKLTPIDWRRRSKPTSRDTKRLF